MQLRVRLRTGVALNLRVPTVMVTADEVMMPYNFVLVRDERPIGNTPWTGSFESAKQHAMDHLSIRGADRVEVRDDDTQPLLFHHPRTLKVSGR